MMLAGWLWLAAAVLLVGNAAGCVLVAVAAAVARLRGVDGDGAALWVDEMIYWTVAAAQLAGAVACARMALEAVG